MAITRSFSRIFLFIIFNVIIFPTSSLAKSGKPNKHVALFIFGDSVLDAGNNNYINTTTSFQSNFWPYGETFLKFPTGRFSDGRLIPDFITEYAELPLIPPFLQPGTRWYYNGVNFASAGAGALAETFQGNVIDLRTQLSYYKKVEKWLKHKLGNDEAKMTISRSVFMIGIGSNDYAVPFIANSTVLNSFSESQYVEMVIGNLTQVIKELYKNGGRKFSFINVAPLGCAPSTRMMRPENSCNCLKEASSCLAKLHNAALSKALLNLKKELKGFKHSLFDFNNIATQIMNSPSKYGFKEGKTACCGSGDYRGVFSCGGQRGVKEFQLCENPNEYIFWDSSHLTEMSYGILAEQMWNGASNSHIVGPCNLKQLFQDY